VVSLISREKNLDGMQDILRLIENHPEFAAQYLKEINVALMKQVKNLRSQVSRAALQAYAELFVAMEKRMEPVSHFDEFE
jgi:hypothetical protein